MAPQAPWSPTAHAFAEESESESIEEETVKQQQHREKMLETLIKERDRLRNEIEAAKKREELEEQC